MNYKNDLEIDTHSLEAEWEKQPSLFMQYAEQEADAQEERDKAARNKDVVKAEMDAEVRSHPGEYGIEKVSESAISNVILLTPEYRAAEEKLIAANKQMRLLSAAVVAFEHKKRALTKLTDLWINGYFGGQGIPVTQRERVAGGKKDKQVAGLNEKRRQRLGKTDREIDREDNND